MQSTGQTEDISEGSEAFKHEVLRNLEGTLVNCCAGIDTVALSHVMYAK